MNHSKRNPAFRTAVSAMVLLLAAALVLMATPSSALDNGEGSTKQLQRQRLLRGGSTDRSLLRNRIGFSSGAADNDYATSFSAEAPLKVGCQTSDDCPIETYCASGGFCLPIGDCDEVSDCEDPSNVPWPMVYCYGTMVCEEGTCGMDCEQIPDDDRKPQPPTCPVDLPGVNEPCTGNEEGLVCPYQYFYKGCAWDELRCEPATTCSCTEREPGVFGWACFVEFLEECPEPEPAAEEPAVAMVASARQEVIPTKPPRDPEALPLGGCDPDALLPPPPPSAENPGCPIVAPRSMGTSCEGYEVGVECQYGHVYTGCSWDDLSCSWIHLCTCSPEGFFVCAMTAMETCEDEVVVFDGEEERAILVDTIPEGLPWGESCSPGAELPKAPVEVVGGSSSGNSTDTEDDDGGDWEEEDDALIDDVDTVAVDGNVTIEEAKTDTEDVNGRLSDECPANYEFGSCSGYVPDLRCDYNHMYTGCTWDTLRCTAIMQCTCGGLSRGGEWACMSFSLMPCESTPEGHPAFESCDPNDPLPTGPVEGGGTAESGTSPSESLPLLGGGALP